MAERRLTYFSLIHDQYLVDIMTEREIEQGRLQNYDALYVAEPCLSAAACGQIRRWVENGGWLYGSCAAASRNEFNENQAGLADVFGISPKIAVKIQKGRFDLRGALNDIAWLDQVHVQSGHEGDGFGAIGIKAQVTPATASVTGLFSDGSPATLRHRFGRGTAVYAATCPALSYAKDAHFVPAELKEKWPARQRAFINSVARASGAPRLVELSHPVVEAGVFESANGLALILANFTYEHIPRLVIGLAVKQVPRQVKSVEKGVLPFTMEPASPRLEGRGEGGAVRPAFHHPWGIICVPQTIIRSPGLRGQEWNRLVSRRPG